MPQLTPFTILVLAAGKGTRMRSSRAKVLHEVFHVPMIHHVLHAVLPLEPSRAIVIVGHQQEEVRKVLQDFPVEFVTQEKQLGTGHAVLATESVLADIEGVVMIVCGDTPLVRPSTLQEMRRQHLESQATLTLMTTVLDNPTNYGRILNNGNGGVAGIVEEKDASPEQKAIREINAGIYCVDKKFLFQALHQVGTENSQGEMYLTDIVALAVTAGYCVERYFTSAAQDVLGVNSRVELAAAHMEIQRRRNIGLMQQGVSMHNPESVIVSAESTIGCDSLLMAGVQILGSSRIGEACRIEPGVILKDCAVGDNVVIGPYSCMEACSIPNGTVVGPYCREYTRDRTMLLSAEQS